MENEDESKITKTIFSNFLINIRQKVKSAVLYTVRALKRDCKALKEGKVRQANSEDQKIKRIKYFEDQIAALKSFTPDDIGKFAVVVQKQLDVVLNDCNASIEQKALTRIAYHKLVIKDVVNFRKKYPSWEQSIPNIIKSFGIKYRKERIKRLKKKNRKGKVLESERKLFILMNEVVGLGIDAKLLKETGKEGIVALEQKKKSDNSKKVKKSDSPVKNEELKSPVEITSIFENLEDDEEEDDDSFDDEDEEKDPKDSDSFDDEDEQKDTKETLQEKQFYKDKNKTEIIKKNEENNKSIGKNKNIKSFNNNNNNIIKNKINNNKINNNNNINSNKINNNKINNNNKRKNSSSTIKETTPNPSKKPKVCKIPLSTSREIKEPSQYLKPPTTRAFDDKIIKKQNKGTCKVILLDLSKVGKKNDEEGEESEFKDQKSKGDSSESEDESFLSDGRIIENKKKVSNFFINRNHTTGSDNASDSDDESSAKTDARSGLNPVLKRKMANGEDISSYDSTKFFKREIFRGHDTSRGRGRFSGVSRKFGEKSLEGKKNFENEDYKQGFMGRGRGRGHLGNKEKWNSSSKYKEDRGFTGRGRGRENREGFVSRGRGQDRRNKSSGFSENSNFMPLGKNKRSPIKKESETLLHPSWAAKKLQMEQMAKTAFQGKKTVFED